MIMRMGGHDVVMPSDPITRSAEPLFLNLVPHHKRVVVEGAGHFLQETHGEILAENIVKFLGGK